MDKNKGEVDGYVDADRRADGRDKDWRLTSMTQQMTMMKARLTLMAHRMASIMAHLTRMASMKASSRAGDVWWWQQYKK